MVEIKLVNYSVFLSSYSFIFGHALLLLQKQSSKRQLVAVTGVKLVSSQYFATAACSSLLRDLGVMVEDDRGKIIPTSLLLRPTTPPDRDNIVKLTGSDTMENNTDEVSASTFTYWTIGT